jgi:hypothetical protein
MGCTLAGEATASNVVADWTAPLVPPPASAPDASAPASAAPTSAPAGPTASRSEPSPASPSSTSASGRAGNHTGILGGAIGGAVALLVVLLAGGSPDPGTVTCLCQCHVSTQHTRVRPAKPVPVAGRQLQRVHCTCNTLTGNMLCWLCLLLQQNDTKRCLCELAQVLLCW